MTPRSVGRGICPEARVVSVRSDSGRPVPKRGELAGSDLAIVEVDRLGAEDLVGLVSLAGDDHHIARPGERQRERDRGTAVGFDEDVVATLPGHALDDLGDDRLRVFAARIVGGRYRQVGEVGGDRAHERPLAAVAVAAAAEHAQQPAGGHRPHGAQDARQRIGCVRVVDEHGERLPAADGFEPAGHDRPPRRAPRRRRRRAGPWPARRSPPSRR